MKRYKTLSIATIAVAVCGHALAAPGELDPTFAHKGLTTIRKGYGQAAVQQPDGKLLIATRGSGFTVLRLNPDGSPDTSFGNGGAATIEFARTAKITDLALTIDGKIVGVGTAYLESPFSRLAVARLNANGTLDTSFDEDGRVMLDSGRSSQSLWSVVSTPDGRIVAAGHVGNQDGDDIMLLRLLASGMPDPTFGAGTVPGMVVVNSGLDDYPTDLIALPDGKYLTCGYAEVSELVYVGTMLAVRLNQDGALDTGFGSGGFVRLETTARGYSTAAEACVARSDGSMVLAGWELRDAGHPAPLLMRLRSDGARDTGTWNDGLAVFELGRANATAIVEVDGGFAISGTVGLRTVSSTTVSDAYVAHVDGISGALAADFGNHGVTTLDFNGTNSYASDVATRALLRQPDGKLVIVGGAWLNGGWEGWDGWAEITVARVDPRDGGSPGLIGFTEAIIRTTTNAVLTVRRTGGSVGALLVDFETVPRIAVAPRDYTHTRGTLSWADGDMEPRTIEVPVNLGSVTMPERWFDVLLIASPSVLSRDKASVRIGPVPADTVIVRDFSGSGGGGGAGALGPEALLWLVAVLLSRRQRQGKFRRCMNEA